MFCERFSAVTTTSSIVGAAGAASAAKAAAPVNRAKPPTEPASSSRRVRLSNVFIDLSPLVSVCGSRLEGEADGAAERGPRREVVALGLEDGAVGDFVRR